MVILARIAAYVGLAALVAWLVGWWVVEDCVGDNASTGGDGGLCGVGWVVSGPVFVGTVVLLALVVELTLARRRRAVG